MKTNMLKRLSISLMTGLFLATLTVPIMNTRVAEAFSGTGGGTPSSPYLISTCEQLQSIDAGSNSQGVLYKLTGNIDCAATSSWNGGTGFDPIGQFRGTLDGQGHTITGLHINRPTEDGIGIFSEIYEGSLVINLKIDATSTFVGRYSVGSIAGYSSYAKIIGVKSEADVSGLQLVGGFVGEMYGWSGEAVIRQSEFAGSVTATDGSVGGFAGAANNGWDMFDVLSNGTVDGPIAGGIVGIYSNSCGYRNMERAVVYSTVSGSTYQGGIAGYVLNVTCSEANVKNTVSFAQLQGEGVTGGLYGQKISSTLTHTNVFFDYDNAGTNNCVGADNGVSPTCNDIGSNVPPTDAPYDAFDFTNVWNNADPLTLRSFVNSYTSPGLPTNLTVLKGENGDGVNVAAAQIDWGAPSSAGSTPIRTYRYQVKESTHTWASTMENGNTSSTDPFNIYDLRPGITYNVRVQAYNEYSGSGWVEIEYTPGAAAQVAVDTCEELAAIDDNLDNIFANIEVTKDIDCTGFDLAPPWL